MNRNQKIALGCGGAGCLGLIVVIVAGVLIYMFTGRLSSSNSNRIFNSNSNSNSNRSTNRNSSSVPDTNSSESNSSDASSSMSDDEKHRLFQAASMASDSALVQKVLKKMGLMTASGATSSEYEEFVKDHVGWILQNVQFIKSLDTPEKAKAYVDEHMSD